MESPGLRIEGFLRLGFIGISSIFYLWDLRNMRGDEGHPIRLTLDRIPTVPQSSGDSTGNDGSLLSAYYGAAFDPPFRAASRTVRARLQSSRVIAASYSDPVCMR